jgi:hypothetical protein
MFTSLKQHGLNREVRFSSRFNKSDRELNASFDWRKPKKKAKIKDREGQSLLEPNVAVIRSEVRRRIWFNSVKPWFKWCALIAFFLMSFYQVTL